MTGADESNKELIEELEKLRRQVAASQALAGDVYAPLTKPNGKLVGLCSAENIDATADIWEVRARHVKLPPHKAYSSWAIPAGESAQHLDGTITRGDRNYVFHGRIEGQMASALRVVVLNHGKPDPNNLTAQVATPSGGCDGPCRLVGECVLSLE